MPIGKYVLFHLVEIGNYFLKVQVKVKLGRTVVCDFGAPPHLIVVIIVVVAAVLLIYIGIYYSFIFFTTTNDSH